MKNAYVLEHHFGDDGNAPEGQILLNVQRLRFEQLEKQGLVREATEEEVEAGYQPGIDADESAGEGDERDAGGEKKKPAPANKKAPTPPNKGS